MNDPLIAVATRIAGPNCPGDIQSWDLAVYGDGFEPLTLDPFSFVGEFWDEGLIKLRMELLGLPDLSSRPTGQVATMNTTRLSGG